MVERLSIQSEKSANVQDLEKKIFADQKLCEKENSDMHLNDAVNNGNQDSFQKIIKANFKDLNRLSSSLLERAMFFAMDCQLIDELQLIMKHGLSKIKESYEKDIGKTDFRVTSYPSYEQELLEIVLNKNQTEVFYVLVEYPQFFKNVTGQFLATYLEQKALNLYLGQALIKNQINLQASNYNKMIDVILNNQLCVAKILGDKGVELSNILLIAAIYQKKEMIEKILEGDITDQDIKNVFEKVVTKGDLKVIEYIWEVYKLKGKKSITDEQLNGYLTQARLKNQTAMIDPRASLSTVVVVSKSDPFKPDETGPNDGQLKAEGSIQPSDLKTVADQTGNREKIAQLDNFFGAWKSKIKNFLVCLFSPSFYEHLFVSFISWMKKLIS